MSGNANPYASGMGLGANGTGYYSANMGAPGGGQGAATGTVGQMGGGAMGNINPLALLMSQQLAGAGGGGGNVGGGLTGGGNNPMSATSGAQGQMMPQSSAFGQPMGTGFGQTQLPTTGAFGQAYQQGLTQPVQNGFVAPANAYWYGSPYGQYGQSGGISPYLTSMYGPMPSPITLGQTQGATSFTPQQAQTLGFNPFSPPNTNSNAQLQQAIQAAFTPPGESDGGGR